MATFAIRYTYGENSEAAKAPYSEAHMQFLTAQFEAKRLLLSGRLLADEASGVAAGALLIVSGESLDDVTRLMDGEPFMQNGVVARREIAEWTIAFGEIAR